MTFFSITILKERKKKKREKNLTSKKENWQMLTKEQVNFNDGVIDLKEKHYIRTIENKYS